MCGRSGACNMDALREADAGMKLRLSGGGSGTGNDEWEE